MTFNEAGTLVRAERSLKLIKQVPDGRASWTYETITVREGALLKYLGQKHAVGDDPMGMPLMKVGMGERGHLPYEACQSYWGQRFDDSYFTRIDHIEGDNS